MKVLQKLNHYYLLPFVVIVYLLVVSFLNWDYINRDGVLYLIQANVFLQDGFLESLNVYNWPFLSILIATFSNYFSIELIDSAKFLNFLFLIILLFFFYKIINLYTSNHPNLSLIFVLLSIPIFDDYYPMVIRDIPGLAFFTSASYYFLNFIKSKNILNIVIGNFFLLFSVLFRIEFIFLLLINLYFAFSYLTKKNFTIFFILFLIIPLLFLIQNFNEHSKLVEFQSRFIYLLKSINDNNLINSSDEYLQSYLNSHQILSRFSIASSFFIKQLFSSVGFLHLAILPFAIKYLISEDYKKDLSMILLFFAFLILSYNFVFIFTHFVSSTRYFLPFLIIVYIFNSVFFIDKFFSKYKKKNRFKQKIFYIRWFIIFFLFLSFINILYDKKSVNKDLIIADWISSNIENKNACYIEQIRVSYYLGDYNQTQKPKDAIIKSNFQCLILHESNFSNFQEILMRNYSVKYVFYNKNMLPYSYVLMKNE